MNLESHQSHLYWIYGVSIPTHKKAKEFSTRAYISWSFMAHLWSSQPKTLLEVMSYDVLSTYYVFNRVDDRMRSLWSYLCTNCAFVLWNAHVITASLCVKFFDLLKAFFKIWATHRGDGHMAFSPYGNDIGDWESLCARITNMQLALYCIVIWLKLLGWTSFHQVMLAPCQLYVINGDGSKEQK